jgi:hypothetical protein
VRSLRFCYNELSKAATQHGGDAGKRQLIFSKLSSTTRARGRRMGIDRTSLCCQLISAEKSSVEKVTVSVLGERSDLSFSGPRDIPDGGPDGANENNMNKAHRGA